MSDLFGTAAPAKAKIKVELPQNRAAGEPERGPAFGTPAWDRCRCGAWATFHFPLVGGLRRCLRCARAEGRISEDRR